MAADSLLGPNSRKLLYVVICSHGFFGSVVLNGLLLMFSSWRPCGAGCARCASTVWVPSSPAAAVAAVPTAARMKARRLMYNFLSVISELGMSGARLINIWKNWQVSRLKSQVSRLQFATFET